MRVDARVTPLENVYLKGDVTSVDGAIERMEELTRYIEVKEPRGVNDGLGSFNYLYTVITKRVRDGIDNGFFEDREFLTQLDIEFANRYFSALRVNVLSPEDTPNSWSVLLDQRSDDRIEAIQFAIAGVNAHVNYDLAIAVVDTCSLLHTKPGHGTQESDYRKINQIFSEEMQALRQHYENQLARTFDDVFSPVLNLLCDWSVIYARGRAWKAAESLWNIRRRGDDESLLIHRLDQRASMSGSLFLIPLV